jgi:hypothetical protein
MKHLNMTGINPFLYLGIGHRTPAGGDVCYMPYTAAEVVVALARRDDHSVCGLTVARTSDELLPF